jgi:hypothetical protein
LEILNISGNNLESLSEIGSLSNLVQINASNNSLSDMKEMAILLKCWPRLVTLDLSGNPLCLKNKYRERIIVLATSLRQLDGKEIQDMSRQFLENWKLSKEMSNQRAKQELISNADVDSDSFSSELVNNKPVMGGSENGGKLNSMSMPTYVMPGEPPSLSNKPPRRIYLCSLILEFLKPSEFENII